ncbi:MAG: hypothetical protein KBC73_23050 [Burkholderiaceae bacterium]|nr:hypothetical protein [Burkholderiaceae bacterium]
MTVLRELRRLAGRTPLTALAVAASTALLLSACGGGTSQVQAFKPDRMLAFGDENSVIVDATDSSGNHDGFKYTINDRTATTGLKCTATPIFTQSVAGLYGFSFAECREAATAIKAYTLAKVDAKVGDAVSGLAQQMAEVQTATGKALGSGDLVTVLIGANDMLALYAEVKAGTRTSAEARTEAKARGALAAARINEILGTGARALVITLPDMGLSPYALTEETTRPGAVALLSQMSYDYNAEMRTRIDATAYDGRNYGLVLADDIVSAIARYPSAYLSSPAVANVAACDATLAPTVTQCTTTTLVSGASSSSHLWADATHLGPEGHSRIASQAQSRALNNPF